MFSLIYRRLYTQPAKYNDIGIIPIDDFFLTNKYQYLFLFIFRNSIMSSRILCGPCQYEDNIKGAKKSCTDCEDGYCQECEKVHRCTKMSRNHKLISIGDYQKIKNIRMNQHCEDHGKRFDLYCSMHDQPLCIACVNQHKSCTNVTPLDEAARNAKQSTAFADLEDTINAALESIGKSVNEQEAAEKHVGNQKQKILKSINELRKKINKHLNDLEQKLIHDLSAKCAKCKSSHEKILQQLNSSDKKLLHFKEETQKMKKFASDVQLFLGTRDINRYVANEIRSLTTTINGAHQFKIEADMDLLINISSLIDRSNGMGKILLHEIPTGFKFKDAKIDQAQKQVAVTSERDFCDLHLQFKKKLTICEVREINMHVSKVSGCIIMPNGHLLFTDYEGGRSKIRRYIHEGNISNINHEGCSIPFDLTLIDADNIAISFVFTVSNYSMRRDGGLTCGHVAIKHIKSGSSRDINANASCWGISHHDGRLYVIVDGEGILVADVSGKVLKTLKINTGGVKYISTSTDMICFTNERRNTVHCCNMEGTERWVFSHNTVICPAGVSVGEDNDVFIVSKGSKNITLIHRDGTESKTLLTEADGLNVPQAISYDTNSKTLLVCDKNSSYAWLYNAVFTI